VFWNYWRGGHKRAEKVAVYYTLFAVAFFIFSTVMWVSQLVFSKEPRIITTIRIFGDGHASTTQDENYSPKK
jgi:hypothetical protein